jgi:hypothetical protein
MMGDNMDMTNRGKLHIRDIMGEIISEKHNFAF